MAPRIHFVCDHSKTEKDMEYWLRKYAGSIRHSTVEGVQVEENPAAANYIFF